MRCNNWRRLYLDSPKYKEVGAIGSSTLLGAARGLRLSALFWCAFSACGGLGAWLWRGQALGMGVRLLILRAVASGLAVPSACVWSLGAQV